MDKIEIDTGQNRDKAQIDIICPIINKCRTNKAKRHVHVIQWKA